MFECKPTATFAWRSAREGQKDPIRDWPEGFRAPTTDAWDDKNRHRLRLRMVFLPTKDLIMSFSAIDTEGVTTRTGFDTLFKDGTTLATEARLTIRPFGLTGHQLIGFAWSNADFNSLSQDRRTLIGNALFGASLKKESGSWAFMYNFESVPLSIQPGSRPGHWRFWPLWNFRRQSQSDRSVL